MRTDAHLEDLLRRLAPQVLGALVRRYGHFDACEDAVQEALLAAARDWPAKGLPERPRAWLITVASRRLTDELRADSARQRREIHDATRRPTDAGVAPGPDHDDPTLRAPGPTGEPTTASDPDDTLALLFLCCDPALSAPAQMALTLRAVGGLTTAEIAAAFLVPEATMAQRISRAKARLRELGRAFPDASVRPGDDHPARLAVVRHVLYLIFNEGYSAVSGHELQRRELAAEAIRLARLLHDLTGDDPETAGLLALMVLTDARHQARTTPDGALVALADQDRSRWDHDLIDEGTRLLESALAQGSVGPYQLQAAIAAVHAEAPDVEATDWAQILGLYDLLERVAPNPMTSLNRVVAVAEVHGAERAMAVLEAVAADPRLQDNHRVPTVRGHLLERLGDPAGAAAELRRAARLTTSLPERRHLQQRADGLVSEDGPGLA